MISNPYDHRHPLFQDQREYILERAILDTGDAETEAMATLFFRHRQSDRLRSFRFSGVAFTSGCGTVARLRGDLPVYVASIQGRGWEGGVTVEVGDTDRGGVWFWAQAVEEAS